FGLWFSQAVEVESTEPNAMMLASVDGDGQPHLRTLLLKGFDERGFVFFTNYQSAKAGQLLANPRAAMTFWWHDLERQVRIEGQGIRPLLPQPPSGQSAGRLDLTPEPGDQRPRRARTASGRGRSAVCRCRAGASTARGRLPSGAADDRILAGPAEPAA